MTPLFALALLLSLAALQSGWLGLTAGLLLVLAHQQQRLDLAESRLRAAQRVRTAPLAERWSAAVGVA